MNRMDPVKCAAKDCERTYAPHYWGKVRVNDEGWFFPKAGPATCPDHNPPWVAAWRERKK